MKKRLITKKMKRELESLGRRKELNFNLSKEQREGVKEIGYKFAFLAQWLHFKESLEIGENAKPPSIENQYFEYLPIYGDYWWFFFRCMIKGWDYIEESASLDRRVIQSSPRATFLAVLEEEFNFASSKIQADNSGLLSKAILKDWLFLLNNYLRKKNINFSVYDDLDNINQFEQLLKNSGLHYYLLVCLRNNPKNNSSKSAVYYPWREFLKVCKLEKAFMTRKGSQRKFQSDPFFIQWVRGTPYLANGTVMS